MRTRAEPLPPPIGLAEARLDRLLTETADWLLIRKAAREGLLAKISIEERGMEIDRKAGRDDRVAERLAKLELCRRALARVESWAPVAGEIPRRVR